MIKNRVGEKWITRNCGYLTILVYYRNDNCTIQFEDGTIVEKVKYGNIKKGTVKNPMQPSVFGVGYTGVGVYMPTIKRKPTKIYITWHNMLQRCYDKKYFIGRPSYKGCSVISDWHNFQNFAAWYSENYIDDFHLDKDVTNKKNKIYSPMTCEFVPLEINNLLTKSDKARGDYPIGVSYNKGHEKFQGRGYINGNKYFDCKFEAFDYYKQEKEDYIKIIANKYRGQITEPCYWALINYIVEIDD